MLRYGRAGRGGAGIPTVHVSSDGAAGDGATEERQRQGLGDQLDRLVANRLIHEAVELVRPVCRPQVRNGHLRQQQVYV